MPRLALLKPAHKVTQCYYKTWQAYSEQAEDETALRSACSSST
jgi:hypothetical protein